MDFRKAASLSTGSKVRKVNFGLEERTPQEVEETGRDLRAEPVTLFPEVFVVLGPLLVHCLAIRGKLLIRHLLQLGLHLFKECFHPGFQIGGLPLALYHDPEATLVVSGCGHCGAEDDIAQLFSCPQDIECRFVQNVGEQ